MLKTATRLTGPDDDALPDMGRRLPKLPAIPVAQPAASSRSPCWNDR